MTTQEDVGSLRKRGLLVAMSLLATVALCEVALRIFWRNPFRHELQERTVVLRIHHGLTDQTIDRRLISSDPQRVAFRTDERGYILPARRFDKPDATVAFLGGSTTECEAVQEHLRFPALVSTICEARGVKLNTLNAGRSGNTTQDAVNLLVNHIAEDRPDIVVLMEATNDIGFLAAEGSYKSRMALPLTFSGSLRWYGEEASRNLSLAALLRKALTGRTLRPDDVSGVSQVQRRTLPRAEYEGRLRAFIGAARGLGIEPVLMTQPLSFIRNELTPDWTDSQNQDVFNEIIRRTAAKENIGIIDLARHVRDQVPGWNEPMRIFYDGVHVTDAGSRAYAEFIAENLLERMRKRDASK
jgi:lysophospholipase L1-like esterase